MPLYTQYMMNGFLINPAAAGSEGFTSFNLTAREQWIGFPGSPRTFSFSGQTRLPAGMFNKKPGRRSSSKASNAGLGGTLYNDHNGLVDRTGVDLAYSYHIKVGRESQISMGLTLTGYQFKVNQALMDENSVITGDPLLSNQDNLQRFIADANFGVWYTSTSIYGGISATNLFQTYRIFARDNQAEFKQNRNFFVIGGYRHEFNRDWSMEPSVLVKVVDSGSTQADVGMRFYYREDYWAGVSYRTGAKEDMMTAMPSALCLMVGFKLDKVYVGYSFDYTLSELQSFSFGSHEFMLAIKFGSSYKSTRWLNRY